MRSFVGWMLCGSIFVLLGSGSVHAGRAGLSSLDLEAVQTPTFMQFHPDLRWRLSGLRELERGADSIAFKQFRRASLYADKLSQAMVAEMLWEGVGTLRDRPAAYAWMDLAAERGYPALLLKREAFWTSLDEAERRQALAAGEAIYAEFGDDVALPRLKNTLRKGLRSVTGSRAGNTMGVRAIYPGGPAGVVKISAFNPKVPGLGELTSLGGARLQVFGGMEVQRMWSDHFWRAEEYLDWKEVEIDSELVNPGRVDVLPLRAID